MSLNVNLFGSDTFAQTNSPAAVSHIRIVELQGAVEISPAGATAWTAVATNRSLYPFDRLRTGPNSRVALIWSDQSIIPFGASTELEILPPQDANSQSGLHLVRGVLSFFHRDKPGRIRILTRGATAGIEGTEFVLAVNNADQTTLSVVDGKVRFGNDQATLVLTNGEQAVAEVGRAPVRTAGFQTVNLLQWCFYYPAVLDLADLPLSNDEQSALADSLAAYRSGDLLQALAKYPAGRTPASDTERLYRAALLLSVGQVDQTEVALASLSAGDARPQQLAAALRKLIAAVKHTDDASAINHQFATELLAASYYEQSHGIRGSSLESALNLAREATAKSPDFGFAWTRVAELEFSFGRTRKAMDALDKGLNLAPRNAQALSLKGFLLAAEGKTAAALSWFDRALEVDSALGNAWLGRGLCRIRRGDLRGGREDLLIGAALEPQRAELRNYLGKAFGDTGDFPHAEKELKLAQNLDPQDPTPWLYSALVNENNNRVNDAIRDLEKSQQLNDNRSVYRSQPLLDQDHAVRSANLARIYSDAGMTDLSVREASRAVTYDYANYSAHLFLANSYERMRDKNMYDLRYNTPAISEYYLANLLAPVNAGPISSAISQGEYSPLFNQNHIGLISDTEYLSRGAWSQGFAQYGIFDTFNYSVEGTYRTDPGQRNNNNFELRHITLSLKQQLTPQDSVFFQVDVAKWETGDVSQRYDPASASPSLRSKETQVPNLTLGYHHEWSPGVHTVILLGRHVDETSANTTNAGAFVTFIEQGVIVATRNVPASIQYEPSQELYSAELQQIFEQNNHSTLLGALYQHTDFAIRDFETTDNPDYFAVLGYGVPLTIASQNVQPDFERISVYGYHSWQVSDPLLLIGGLSYDRIFFPRDWNSPPVSAHQETKDQVSPKVGLVWTPTKSTTVRAAYTRSLSGTSLDQSFRIEPTQVAGLNQSFRSLISESIAGATSGARFDAYGLSLEQKFETGTYLGLSGELLYSDVDRLRGTYFFDSDDPSYATLTDFRLRERLQSRERSLVFTADQLLDKEWAVGLRYRFTQAELSDDMLDVGQLSSEMYDISPHQHAESLLHQVNLHANFNHVSGFFSSAEAIWYLSRNSNHTGDDFWQINLLGGYRFWHRCARLETGILNLTDQDYRLNPLVWHNDPPRARTFVARFLFSF
ncbi:MAG TPA: TonB-dependent receptor [Candidatus Paceibacterota bacterium]|nr:TonB-dependent receptor [Candidatus Paceibacterota bacterium]